MDIDQAQRQLVRQIAPPRGKPVRIIQGVVSGVNSEGTVNVTEEGASEDTPDVDLLGQAALGGSVWVLGFGDGDRLALGSAGVGEITDDVDMHNRDISASGPGPDVWPRGICWAAVSSAWTGRPGSTNGVLTSHNAGNFTPAYQTYFTGTTMYVRNRATETAWGAWRVAWGPV